jgi:hypothetical protein
VSGGELTRDDGGERELTRDEVLFWLNYRCPTPARRSRRVVHGLKPQTPFVLAAYAVARHGKRRSSSASACAPDSPKRCAHNGSQSSLSKKNFQSSTTACLTKRNGTGDVNGRKLAL